MGKRAHTENGSQTHLMNMGGLETHRWMDESGRLVGMSWPWFREFGINVFTVWKPSFACNLAEREQENRIPSLCLLVPLPCPPHPMWLCLNQWLFFPPLHPFSGKPILCVWNSHWSHFKRNPSWRKILKTEWGRIYPNCQIFIYYSLGPQSQHYPWEEVKSTYQNHCWIC